MIPWERRGIGGRGKVIGVDVLNSIVVLGRTLGVVHGAVTLMIVSFEPGLLWSAGGGMAVRVGDDRFVRIRNGSVVS